MKITPSNQTLILASERRGPGAPSGGSPGKAAATSAAPGPLLQRVTIVAARPDTSLLYLQADYSAATDAPRDAYGNTVSGSIGTQAMSSYLNPVEQYARTQRILGVVSRVPQIDVHA